MSSLALQFGRKGVARRLRTGLLFGILCGLLCGLFCTSASAQESLDDIDGTKKAETGKKISADVNGYVDNRFQYAYINPSKTLVPTINQPSLLEILEGNIQLKVSIGQKAFVYADVSLIYQNGWLYYDRDQNGDRVKIDDHDVSTLRPFIVPSELYVSVAPKNWLNLLVGKKRIIWGSGFAFNPTDLINPPKDPTDPNFQRAGQWVARIELPFEKFTISTLFAPQVLYQQNGLPFAMMKYPDYQLSDGTKPADDAYHYLFAARLYLLLFNTDINLFYFFSNKYNDSFENTSRFGGSFSRYFFTDYELHFEALFQFGSGKLFANHACANGGICNPSTALSASKLTDGNLYPRLLVGGRTQFRDESTLSLEYYYQGDGYSALEFEDYLRLLARAQAAGITTISQPTGGTTGAVPQRFTFDPLRRHYLFLSYNKPKIRDDFSIGATLIAGLSDLSGTISPTVSWNAQEWLTLSLFGFIPIRGIPVGTVNINDVSYSEYSLLPMDFRFLFEARAFY
ncbi:MAG TPA: hypothetical protein PKL17_08985 [Pseudomonadota bacterium]|nr:hypothetical protein [Pseudomonadota bacterium]